MSGISADDIKEFLMSSNFKIESCFPAKSWLRNVDSCDISAFRLCIKLGDKDTVLKPEFWPSGVIVREWRQYPWLKTGLWFIARLVKGL